MKVFYRGKTTVGFEILKYLYEHPGARERDLQYYIGGGWKSISTALRTLMDNGLITRVKAINPTERKFTRKTVYRYYLTGLGYDKFVELWNEWKRKVKPEFVEYKIRGR